MGKSVKKKASVKKEIVVSHKNKALTRMVVSTVKPDKGACDQLLDDAAIGVKRDLSTV